MNTILSKDEKIQKLQKQLKEKELDIQQLKKENTNLQGVVEKLTHLLNIFCNPHTPPSKQLLNQKRNKDQICKKLGAPQGHRGATRITPKPTSTKLHTLETCPHCGGKIRKSSEILKRIIEEIPEPQPAEITEHFMQTGICERCGNVVAESDLPEEGDFGKNNVKSCYIAAI